MNISLSHILLLSLLFVTLLSAQIRNEMRARPAGEWMIDIASLLCYFLLLPIAQIAIGYKLCTFLIPNLQNSLEIGWGAALLTHMAIDYAWYWNHRLFHAQTPLWNLHAVHHETRRLDFFASQRNSIWSFLFMIYFWAIPLVLFLAKDPGPFLTLAAVASLINFWGHTQLQLKENSPLKKVLSYAIIQPQDHFWHHSTENPNCNFATLFNFWDKMHGTWHQPNRAPAELGFELKTSFWRKFFFPKF